MINDEFTTKSNDENMCKCEVIGKVDPHLAIIAGVGLTMQAIQLLQKKLNKNKDCKLLNFLLPLDKMEEIELSKKNKRFSKVYKCIAEMVDWVSLSSTSFSFYRSMNNRNIKQDDSLSNSISISATSLSVISSCIGTFNSIAGRALLLWYANKGGYSPNAEADADTRPISTLVGIRQKNDNKNLSAEELEREIRQSLADITLPSTKLCGSCANIVRKSLDDIILTSTELCGSCANIVRKSLDDITLPSTSQPKNKASASNSSLKRSKSDSNLKKNSKGSGSNLKRSQSEGDMGKKYIGILTLRNNIQLTDNTSNKIADMLINHAGKPMDPIYLGVGAEGDTIINIDEEDLKNL